MQKINSEIELNAAIHQLEMKQAEDGRLLKEQFFITYESIKPFNILRSTLSDVSSSPYLIDNILSTAIGLGTGYLSRKIVIGASGNIFKRFLGPFLQLGITNVVAHHPDAVKSVGQYIFQHIFHKKEKNFKNLDS